jgi:ferrous iron transport protein B
MLMAIPAHQTAGSFSQVQAKDSLFGRISSLISPALKPAGFGSWQTSGSLLTGILAKEVIISTMSQIYAVESQVDLDVPDSVGQHLVEIGIGFGKASLLTIQETVNIIPHTINLIPYIDIGELDFFPAEDDQLDTTRLEGSLLEAFAISAGSPVEGSIAAIAFNVFVLLYVPCVSAISAMRQEFGPRWMWAQVAYTLGIAWGGAVITFQVGRLFIG